MSIAQIIAENVANTGLADLDDATRHWTRISILDTMGVAIAGASDPAVQILSATILAEGVTGKAGLLGSRRSVPPLDAALINGTAAHALDFDLSNDTFSGHATVHLLPALLALGQELDASGAQLLTAYAAGFEAQGRLAKGANPTHVKRGWFPTSTLGVFGAAAGAARLLELDIEQTAKAISLAAMFAGGVMAHAGTMTKPLAAGQAARQGLLAALLVQRGFTAADDAIGDRRGFLNLFNGPDTFDKTALSGWSVPFLILETATGIKRHPCCGAFHSSLDVLADVLANNAIETENIESIEAQLVTSRFAHIDRPEPKSGADAKFSVQYCLALIAARNLIRDDDFAPDRFPEGRIIDLMGRIDAKLDPATPANVTRAQEGGARILVRTRDGRELSGQADKPHGRLPGHPLPQADIDNKFLGCVRPVLGEARAGTLLGWLHDLEVLPSLRLLGEAASP